MQIIAEVKTHSPFGWGSTLSWDELFKIADEIGDIISIHTDPRWEGSYDLISKAKSMTKKPILAKGIHSKDIDITKAVEAGADYVLVVGRVPRVYVDKCFVEPLTIKELGQLPKNYKAVWNSRDLATGGLKNESFEDARNAFSGWLCQASNITSISDVDISADAVLIGSHLPEFVKSL